jgi:hypothetical protein
MGLRSMRMAFPLWGLKTVLSHQRPDSFPGGADALVSESGPDLAIALAVERRLGQASADVPGQILIRAGA